MHQNVQMWIQHYGLFGIFFMLMVEMIGVPLPGETILAICGIEWSRGVFSLPALVAVATIANIIGSMVAYAIGRLFGRSFILRFGKWFGITHDRLEKAKAMFQKRETPVILIAKYVAGIRVLVPYLAGINRMPLLKFTLLNAISALVWTAVFIVFGNYVGVAWSQYHVMLHQHLFPVIGASLLLGGIFTGMQIRRRKRKTV